MAEAARPVVFTALWRDTTRTVRVARTDAGWSVGLDDAAPVLVDAVRTTPCSYSLLIDGRASEAHVLVRDGDWIVELNGRTHRIRLLDARATQLRGGAVGGGDREIRAVMPGKIVAVLAPEGAVVEKGQGILVMEAMKMENEIPAGRTGTVARIAVVPGQTVEAGELLAVVES